MIETIVIDNIAIPVTVPFFVIDFGKTLDYYPQYRQLMLNAGRDPKTFQGYLMTFCKWLELNSDMTNESRKDWFNVYIDYWGLSDFIRRCGGKTEDIEQAEKIDLAKIALRAKQIANRD